MVFGWNAETPDPRDDPTLVPTGQHAVVMDRNGYGWSVYEFRYLGIAPDDSAAYADFVAGALEDARPHHAYGVRLGAVHHQHGEWEGETRYNWALSYRLERLFPDGPSVPETPADPVAAATGDALDTVAGTATGTVTTSATIHNPSPAPKAPAEYHIKFGLGYVPESMDVYDPANGGIERFYR